MSLSPRKLLLPILLAASLGACSPQGGGTSEVVAVEIDRSTSCALDGMLLADYPGPKAQIHYQGQEQPDFFCDTMEMFNVLLSPEQVRSVRGVFVQDMGKADWEDPHGHWIDAKGAIFVHGSSRRGSMGPTIASFALEEDARKFSAAHGGKVLRFAEVTPDMAVLDGGALHDSRM